ncbi:TonB-dependent receptor plug domain-containing protein [Gaopeijia maritima]|uniref:TonB-dependent receptor n=1 Tax=Gaopeijia maritima TaxID=3119007 RepID=A0ABU9E7X7_9BACT
MPDVFSISLVRRTLLAAAAGVTLGSAPLAAQVPDTTTTPDTTVFRVEGIRVQATRPVTTVGGASAVEIDLDALPLPPAATAEEVLREVPMVHLRTNSRGEAEVTIRGSESRQVAVLFDGVPLTLGWDARTDVSILPAGAAQEVTVVRGLSSILHGPNVLGGVVEMNVGRSRDRYAPASLSFSMGGDDRGGFGGTAVGSTPVETEWGGGSVRAGVGFRDSPGMPLPGGVVEPVASNGLRLNTDQRSINGFVSGRYVFDAGPWTSVSAASFDAERGIAGELGVEAPRLWRYPEVNRTVLAWSGGTGWHETPLGRGDMEFSVGYDRGSTVIDSYATRAYDEVDGSERGDDRTTTLRLLGDHTLGARGDLRASWTLARIHHVTTADGESDTYEQQLGSLAAETIWRLLDRPIGGLEGLRLSIGGAWDRGSTPKTAGRESLGTIDDWGGRLGLSAVMNDGATLVHAGVSRRGRFPALRESYSEALNRFVPNPELAPERLVSFETGVTTRVGDAEFQVVGFRNALDGAIRRITLEDGKRMRVNADELKSTGVEFIFSQPLGAATLGGDLMLQTVDLVDPDAVAVQPENMPERSGRLNLRFPFLAGVDALAEAEYTGPQYCQHPDSGADVRLDGGTWLNAVLSKVFSVPGLRVGRRIEARVSAQNLADVALYDQCGLPRAGRLLRFELQVS